MELSVQILEAAGVAFLAALMLFVTFGWLALVTGLLYQVGRALCQRFQCTRTVDAVIDAHDRVGTRRNLGHGAIYNTEASIYRIRYRANGREWTVQQLVHDHERDDYELDPVGLHARVRMNKARPEIAFVQRKNDKSILPDLIATITMVTVSGLLLITGIAYMLKI